MENKRLYEKTLSLVRDEVNWLGGLENNDRNTDAVLDLLIHVFDKENVKKEWDVAKNTQDDLTREFYRPRIDYAIGPLNNERNDWG